MHQKWGVLGLTRERVVKASRSAKQDPTVVSLIKVISFFECRLVV